MNGKELTWRERGRLWLRLGIRLAGTILGRMAAETVSLEVASVNGPALALYRRIGFRQAEVLSRWYWLDPVRGR